MMLECCPLCNGDTCRDKFENEFTRVISLIAVHFEVDDESDDGWYIIMNNIDNDD